MVVDWKLVSDTVKKIAKAKAEGGEVTLKPDDVAVLVRTVEEQNNIITQKTDENTSLANENARQADTIAKLQDSAAEMAERLKTVEAELAMKQDTGDGAG